MDQHISLSLYSKCLKRQKTELKTTTTLVISVKNDYVLREYKDLQQFNYDLQILKLAIENDSSYPRILEIKYEDLILKTEKHKITENIILCYVQIHPTYVLKYFPTQEKYENEKKALQLLEGSNVAPELLEFDDDLLFIKMTNVGESVLKTFSRLKNQDKECFYRLSEPQLINIYEKLKVKGVWQKDFSKTNLCYQGRVCKMIDFKKCNFINPEKIGSHIDYPSLIDFLNLIRKRVFSLPLFPVKGEVVVKRYTDKQLFDYVLKVLELAEDDSSYPRIIDVHPEKLTLIVDKEKAMLNRLGCYVQIHPTYVLKYFPTQKKYENEKKALQLLEGSNIAPELLEFDDDLLFIKMTNVGEPIPNKKEFYDLFEPQLISIYERLEEARIRQNDLALRNLCYRDQVCKLIDFEKATFNVPLSKALSLTDFLNQIRKSFKEKKL